MDLFAPWGSQFFGSQIMLRKKGCRPVYAIILDGPYPRGRLYKYRIITSDGDFKYYVKNTLKKSIFDWHINKERKNKTIQKMANKPICSICLEKCIGTQQHELMLSCEHCFHRKCIYNWSLQFSDAFSCPTCRTVYSPI